jgi:hypothetical protein
MINPLSQALALLPMINQEGGAMPGEGLTAIETFTYFVAAPTVLFLVIGGLSWISTAPKKSKKTDVINQITD